LMRGDRIPDETGSALKYGRHANKGYLHLKIYVPNAVDPTRAVNIEYSVPNATKFFEDHDEFYWSVTGNDWLVPIDSASAMVFFPADTSGSLQVQSYRGIYGSSEPARSVVEGASARAETTKLPSRGGPDLGVYV